MSQIGIRCFVPRRQRMVELWLSREDRSIAARKPLGLGAAVIVGSDEHYCEAIVRTGDGGVKVKMATRAASKLAEGCAWLGALHALAYVGEVGAAALELAAEGGA